MNQQPFFAAFAEPFASFAVKCFSKLSAA